MEFLWSVAHPCRTSPVSPQTDIRRDLWESQSSPLSQGAGGRRARLRSSKPSAWGPTPYWVAGTREALIISMWVFCCLPPVHSVPADREGMGLEKRWGLGQEAESRTACPGNVSGLQGGGWPGLAGHQPQRVIAPRPRTWRPRVGPKASVALGLGVSGAHWLVCQPRRKSRDEPVYGAYRVWCGEGPDWSVIHACTFLLGFVGHLLPVLFRRGPARLEALSWGYSVSRLPHRQS